MNVSVSGIYTYIVGPKEFISFGLDASHPGLGHDSPQFFADRNQLYSFIFLAQKGELGAREQFGYAFCRFTQCKAI